MLEGFLLLYLPIAVLTLANTYLDNAPLYDRREDALVGAVLAGLLWPLLSAEQHIQDLARRL